MYSIMLLLLENRLLTGHFSFPDLFSVWVESSNMEKGSSLPIGPAQFRGLLAILQWWAFNVLVIITNKWIFQVWVFSFIRFAKFYRDTFWNSCLQAMYTSWGLVGQLLLHYKISTCVDMMTYLHGRLIIYLWATCSETGLQVSTDGLDCALHHIYNWCPHLHQGAEGETTHWSKPPWSMEANLPHGLRLLCQHRAWQRQLALHTCLLHANHQVLHSCYNRYASNLTLSILQTLRRSDMIVWNILKVTADLT